MNKTAPLLIKSLFILLFTAFLICGFVLYLAGYTPTTSLSGAYIKETMQLPKGRKEILESIGSGKLFSDVEKIYNQDYPFRPISIKLNNTIDFLQGRSSNTAVCIGKNHELYEYDYLWDYTGSGNRWDGRINKEALRNTAQKLSYIQEEFQKQDKYIYVLITPNKAVFTENNIPDEIRNAGSEKRTRNIDILKDFFDEYNISYFDSSAYIKDCLPQQVIPFYRSGIHYSWPAGYYVAKELFSRIEKETGLAMPRFDITVKEQDIIVFPNRDLFDLLNTIPEITAGVYHDQPQQQAYINNLEPSSVSTVMQGGSFLGPFIDLRNRYPETFRWLDIIQNTIFLPQGDSMINLGSIRDVDLNKIRNDRLYIFEVNETSALSMSFGFIEYLSDYLGTTELISIKPYVLNFSDSSTIMAAEPYGIHDLSATHLPWRFTSKHFGCRLENQEIFTNGLVFQVAVTDDLKTAAKDGHVAIDLTVNGIYIGQYEPDEGGIIRIQPADLKNVPVEGDGSSMIDCVVNSSFIPHELHPENPDMRELSLILYSITAGMEEIVTE